MLNNNHSATPIMKPALTVKSSPLYRLSLVRPNVPNLSQLEKLLEQDEKMSPKTGLICCFFRERYKHFFIKIEDLKVYFKNLKVMRRLKITIYQLEMTNSLSIRYTCVSDQNCQ